MLGWLRSPEVAQTRVLGGRVRVVRLVDAGVGLVVLAALTVLALVVVQLTGLGSTERELARAAQRTVDQGTARVDVVTVTDAGVGSVKQRVDASGFVDLGTGAAELDVRVGVPQYVEGLPSLDGGVAFVVVGDGQESWTRLATGSRARLWTQVAADDASTAAASSDLGTLLSDIAGAMRSVEHVADEDVRGVECAHYRAEVEPAAFGSAAVAALAGAPAESESAPREADAEPDSVVIVDVWLGEGLVRRVSYQVPITPDDESAGVVGAGAMVTTLTELHDFGVPFTATLPGDAERVGSEPSVSATPGVTAPPSPDE